MSKSAWAPVKLGDVTSESRKRAVNDKTLLERTVYGVDRSIGLNPVAKYTANSLERYKLIEQGMFAYNPMRLNIGSIGYCSQDVQPGLVSPDYVVFECNPKKLDPDFLNYYIGSSAWSEWTAKAGVGSVRTRIYYKELTRLPILLPSISEQRAIVEILSALDDKIEVNYRMNAMLETMARAVFRQWLVENDDVGSWKVGRLGDVITNFDSKRIPVANRERAQRQGKYPYYGAASVMDYVDGYLFDGIYVLMGEDGSVVDDEGHPVIQYVWGKIWVNNHAHVLQGANGICNEHLYLFLKEVNILPFITGAVQPKINQANMNSIPFVLPPKELSKKFEEFVSPLFAQIRANDEESRTLGSLRDSLLPKLMRGEVRVKDVEVNHE